MSHRNRIYKVIKPLSRIMLVLTSIFISLIILEISVRLSSWTPKTNEMEGRGWIKDSKQSFFGLDEKRVYKILPSTPKRWGTEWRSDESGFKYNPAHIDKNPEEFKRVVVLGDSFAFGPGVSLKETFPYLLEQKLNSLGYNVWIDNAGVPGYGLDQEYVYLKEEIIPRVKPDIVIWGVNHNDLNDSNDVCLFKKVGSKYYQLSGRFNSLYFKNKYFEKLPKIIKKSYLFSLVDSKIPQRFTIGCSRIEMNESELAEKMEYLFKEAKKLTEENHIELMITLFLNEHYYADNPGYNDWHDRVAWIVKTSELFSRTANIAGLQMLDTNSEATIEPEYDNRVLGYSTLRNTKDRNLFLDEERYDIGWRHTNKDGNDLMSLLTANFLERWFLE